jgi:hypothetical protein
MPSVETHQIHDEPWGQRKQSAPQMVLAVYCLLRGHSQIQHQQRHRDGKYAVAEGSKPFYALAGNLVV